MIPGIISQEYKYNLYDPLDKPPNLIKTIERMLTQLREGYLLSNLQIQNAVADSYIKIFLYSMPKDDITLIFLVFFEPLINMINSGDNLLSNFLIYIFFSLLLCSPSTKFPLLAVIV